MPHFVSAIEPADSGLKIATFEMSFRGAQPHSFTLVPWATPQSMQTPPADGEALLIPETRFAATIRAALVAVPQLRTGEVVCAYPSHQVSTRKLHFPLGDIRKVEPMIGFELEDQIPRGLDELIYAWVVTKNSKDATDLLIATTARTEVRRLLDDYEALGLQPRSLFYEPLAYLGITTKEVPLGKNYVVIDVGSSRTHVLAVSNGFPIYARTLRDGGHRLDVALAKHFNLSTSEAKRGKEGTARILTAEEEAEATNEARDVSKVLRDALRPLIIGIRQTLLPLRDDLDDAIIYVTGGGVALPGFVSLIEAEIGIPTQAMPLPKVLADRPDGHAFTAAWALGQLASSSSRTSRVDFRREEFAFRGDMSQLKTVVPKLVAGVAIVALLALTSGITRYATLSADERALDKTLKEVTKKLMGREMDDFKMALTAMHQSLTPPKSIIPKNSALDYMVTLGQVLPKELDFKISEIDIKNEKLQIKGETTSYDLVEKLTDALRAGACFKEVTPQRSKKSADGQRVEFTFAIELGCAS